VIAKTLSQILIVCAIVVLFKMAMIIVPIKIISTRENVIIGLQYTYSIGHDMAIAVYNAHVVSGYSPMFIAELVLSESAFNPRAVSPKGYKGVLQTPTKTGYLNADMIHGVEILQDKFKIYKDPVDAIAAFKGGKDVPLARQQARAFLLAYEKRKKGDNYEK